MRGDEQWKQVELGLAAAIREGSVSVPMLLLQHYAALKVSETEAMLLIHLIAFREKEGQDFPTLEDIQRRMAASPDTVVKALQRLMQQQLLQIDEDDDAVTGVRSERYNLMPLYRKLAACWAEARKAEQAEALRREPAEKDIYTVFEREFARPLTPMECETITQWLDQDRYSVPLILTALKEAVFAGKLHFRYVDRILLEWSRNRVATPEQAREYAQKFRGARAQSK
ncbi:DnaD domain protein [Paenibacillus koleovorans]|uniref:DnaD domain protein n=1 Tax=Paenibacillus koleovorans TaxID=121608 RepID=UPI000FD77267|nr:DnaD domain protein [Paenibacillus koleovorans]